MAVALLIGIPFLILVLTLLSRLLEKEEEIELDPDEQIIASAFRHWSVIFLRCFMIGLGGFCLIGIATYRAIGGNLLSGTSEPGNDLFNYALIALTVVIAIVGVQQWRRGITKKKPLPTWEKLLFGFVLLTLMFLIAFRADGGRVFNIDPGSAVGIDGLNALLIGLGILLFALLIYTYFDLRDDSLVLTNFRVLRREVQEVPIFGFILSSLMRRNIVISEFLQQIVIEDVQQVSVKQESYFEFYLYQFFRLLERFGVTNYKRYGTIIVQSLSFQVIRFQFASAPNEMQQAILNRVRDVKRNDTPDLLLRRTLEEQVWGNRPASQRRFERGPTQQTAGVLSWLFAPNPQYPNDAKRTVIWRPAWLFILWRMSRALATLVVVIVAAIVISRLELFGGWPLVAITLPLVLACLFWAWWIYETYQHDLYILTSERIIDEDKAPFGPTNRREAELRAIQNVLFEENFFETILGYGDVIVRTGGAGGGDFTFHYVPNPREVQAQINSYIVDFRRREQEQNRRQTIQALTQYHILQDQHAELMNNEKIDALMTGKLSDFASTLKTGPDEEYTRAVIDTARREAQSSARRELHGLVRRFLRRQSRGRA